MNYNQKFQSFYNSKDWKNLREYKFGQANGLCEKCKKNGIDRIGEEVHHIKSIEKYWDLRLRYDNLILLCNDCHNEEHNRISPLQKFLKEYETWQEEDRT